MKRFFIALIVILLFTASYLSFSKLRSSMENQEIENLQDSLKFYKEKLK
jgi:hypothetical protein